MPIPVSDLQKSGRPLDVRVHDFLRGHPQEAFADWEIHAALEGLERNIGAMTIALLDEPARQALLQPVRNALAQLLQRRLVHTQQFNGESYWYAGVQPG